MILVHIKDLTAYLSHPLMQPDEDGNPSRMQLVIDGKRTRAIYSEDGNQALVILADTSGVPMDDYPDIADAYALEQIFGYRTPDLDEDGNKQFDGDGNVLTGEIPADTAVRAVYDSIYLRTLYLDENDVLRTPPPLFGKIDGHKTDHLLLI